VKNIGPQCLCSKLHNQIGKSCLILSISSTFYTSFLYKIFATKNYKAKTKVEKRGKGKIIAGGSSQFYHRSFIIAVLSSQLQRVTAKKNLHLYWLMGILISISIHFTTPNNSLKTKHKTLILVNLFSKVCFISI